MIKRVAVIFRDKCHPHKCGNYLCAKLCPVNRTGKDCIIPSEDKKAMIDEVLCTGCGICPKRCPFDAIKIVNLPEKLNQPPIHRYGVNMFELFSLPSPIFGKVVGTIGKNAIGKSTSLKILAGLLKPNLGENKSQELNKIIHYFRGHETQAFFEKLRDGKIKVSYKPQQVDAIPKAFDGNVRELLEKVGDKKKLKELIQTLDLNNILNRDIKNISGGELQRVAIAACVLKNANLFMIDEPTSYLDIKQRLKISKFIRSLPDSKTAVLVVEHDLIILDYLTDLVHIMYGEEGVYGIVSGFKSTKEGINTFLSGHLREENVRFRDHAIKFTRIAKTVEERREVLCSWTDMRKQVDDFSLSIEGGQVKKEEVVGILGENGIGKTTFVKILAGLIKPDSGKIETKLKVSYKPQYLETNSEQLVMEVVKEAMAYRNQLITPLTIEPLLTKKLNQLSGGELQRVSIAIALAKDADLFLLDEPSAYLDVEQRLLISKVIKNLAHERAITVLVVDHDLLFLDYLSDRLLVCDGVPAKEGVIKGPFSMQEGMNHFLHDLGMTFRRDSETFRPRANKPDSVLDREQKEEHKYYYV